MVHLGKQPRKAERLSIRANLSQKAVLARAAQARHLNVSQFVLQVALNEARWIIQAETLSTVLPEADERLCQVTDEAPAPTPRVRAALVQQPVGDEKYYRPLRDDY